MEKYFYDKKYEPELNTQYHIFKLKLLEKFILENESFLLIYLHQVQVISRDPAEEHSCAPFKTS